MTFELERDVVRQSRPPEYRPLERQRVLFTGLDCLPGQLDLFQCDGPKDRDRDEQESQDPPSGV